MYVCKTTYPPVCPVKRSVALRIAELISIGTLLAEAFALSMTFSSSSVLCFIVFIRFAFAEPNETEVYFSANVLYTVLMTFALAVTPNTECLMVTVSHSDSRSITAAYSGCCHKGSNEIVMFGTGASSEWLSMYESVLFRSISSVIKVPSSNESVKSRIKVFLCSS